MRILALLTHELFIYSFGASLVSLGNELYYEYYATRSDSTASHSM